MKISFGKHLSKSDGLILPLFSNQKSHSEPFSFLMPSTRSLIKDHLNTPYFKAKKGQHIILFPEREAVSVIIIVGLGKREKCDHEIMRRAVADAMKIAKTHKLRSLNLIIPDLANTQAVLEGALLADYQFDYYLTDPKKNETKIENLKLLSAHSSVKIIEEAKITEVICQAVNYTRDLINTPGSDMYPLKLAEEAKKITKLSRRIKLNIFPMKKLKKMGMGLLVGVGQGSKHEPCMIVMEYKNNPKNKQPLLIVGKGITFDTGGMNLKSSAALEDMKLDKAGASTVLGIFKAAALLQPKLHIVGIAVCAENSITDYATKPGDIHRSYLGKTVEITNTDAEGRLVLADGLAYGIKIYKPEAVIDVATLTGACIVALGNDITAILANNQKLIEKYQEAAKKTGEKCWPLPLDPEYAKHVKGSIADLQNFTKGHRADTIMGAAFLKQFVGKIPWIHVDIAATAWTSENKHYITKGATGVPLRTIWKFLEG